MTRRSRAFGSASRDGIQSTGEESCEDANHGVLAAQHNLGDLARGPPSQREHQHLGARARLGIGGVFVATAQVGQWWLIQ